jgi:hypothetical protein
MDPLISLQTPRRDLEVDLGQILTGSDPEEVLDVSDHPLHSSLLIGSSRGTGMNRESIMTHKVQKLGIESELRAPAQNDTFEIIVAVSVSHPSHLPKGSKVTVEEKLHAVTGIEVDVEVSRVGQNQNKPVEGCKRKAPFHPVHLGLLPRQKLQLMKPSRFLLSKGLGMDFYGIVATRVPIPLQTLVDLGDS